MEITNSSPWEMTHPHLILVTIIIYSRHGKKTCAQAHEFPWGHWRVHCVSFWIYKKFYTKIENQYKLGIAHTTPEGNFSDYYKRSYWQSMAHTQSENKKGNYQSLLYLLPLQRNSDLHSSSAGFLSVSSAIGNVHIICRIFTLTNPYIDKSKYKTHRRYIVIIEKFQRSNVMQLSLYS